MRRTLRGVSRVRWSLPLVIGLTTIVAVGCDAGPPPATPPIVPGTSSGPREVNLITRDYNFAPPTLDLVAGETILLHVINGGLAVHEAILGNSAVQDAWEIAEAATIGSPPGATPVVTVPPDVAGVRIVVQSGERIDVSWTVPLDAPDSTTPWVVGCHIPGHWARGMHIPIRWVPPPAVGEVTGWYAL